MVPPKISLFFNKQIEVLPEGFSAEADNPPVVRTDAAKATAGPESAANVVERREKESPPPLEDLDKSSVLA
jgi:hypothetical protein